MLFLYAASAMLLVVCLATLSHPHHSYLPHAHQQMAPPTDTQPQDSTSLSVPQAQLPLAVKRQAHSILLDGQPNYSNNCTVRACCHAAAHPVCMQNNCEMFGCSYTVTDGAHTFTTAACNSWFSVYCEHHHHKSLHPANPCSCKLGAPRWHVHLVTRRHLQEHAQALAADAAKYNPWAERPILCFKTPGLRTKASAQRLTRQLRNFKRSGRTAQTKAQLQELQEQNAALQAMVEQDSYVIVAPGNAEVARGQANSNTTEQDRELIVLAGQVCGAADRCMTLGAVHAAFSCKHLTYHTHCNTTVATSVAV